MGPLNSMLVPYNSSPTQHFLKCELNDVTPLPNDFGFISFSNLISLHFPFSFALWKNQICSSLNVFSHAISLFKAPVPLKDAFSDYPKWSMHTPVFVTPYYFFTLFYLFEDTY